MTDAATPTDQRRFAIQVCDWSPSSMSVRTWVVPADVAERIIAELGAPGSEFIAPAEAAGFKNRVEL